MVGSRRHSAAAALQAKLDRKATGLQFDSLVPCNIGNPHAVKQPPVTFYREVASALYHPRLMLDGDLEKTGLYPSDVLARARKLGAI